METLEETTIQIPWVNDVSRLELDGSSRNFDIERMVFYRNIPSDDDEHVFM